MSESDTLHLAETLYESGSLKWRYSRRLSADGTHWIRHGLFFAYTECGRLDSEGEYRDGKEEGLWRDYHVNGRIAAEGVYLGGKEEGVWRFFDADGKEEKSVVYQSGVEQ